MAGERDPDAELMLRVKKGDAHAFEELVDKYKQPVLNFVHRTLRDSSDAEDIAQNVFVQIFKSADRYRVEAKFSTWLYTIARNLCLNEIRRRSRHPAESLDAASASEENVDALIVDLASQRPQVRRQASERLRRTGSIAVPKLQQALEANPSPVVRARLER